MASNASVVTKISKKSNIHFGGQTVSETKALLSDIAASGTLQEVTANGATTTLDIEVSTIGKGVILKSANGTRYRLTVANGGALSAVAV